MVEEDVKEVEKEVEKVNGPDEVKEEISALEEFRRVNEENKKVLAELKEERKKMENAAAEMLINGHSFAGQSPKVESADEKWAREAKIRYAGTGMDPTE